MKIRTLIAGITAAAVAGTGGLLFTTTAASAQSNPKTLSFLTVEQNAVGYSDTAFSGTDNDYNAAGTLIGFDVLYFKADPVSGKLLISAAVDIDGGLIYGTLTSASSTSPIATGWITGGTGTFRGAFGTITATAQSATASEITVVFAH
jgi:hypothetical protein